MIRKISLALAIGLANQAVCATTTGIEFANFDNSVRAADDFFTHVNGKWLQTTEIPADKSNYGVFIQLMDDVQLKLREIIQKTSSRQDWPSGSDEQKLADFYNSYMDEQRVEQLGIKPVAGLLQQVQQVSSREQLLKLIAELNLIGVNTPMLWYVNNDAKQSTRYIAYVAQSGLTMPDRDYYLKTDDKFVGIRAAYSRYVEDMLRMAGITNPEAAAQRIAQLETKIAQAHWSRVDLRDADKTYNKRSSKDLSQQFGSLGWQNYLDASGLGNESELIIEEPSYLEQLALLLKDEDLAAWQDYLSFQIMDSYAPLLSKPFEDLQFAFHKKQLKGVEQQEERWKRAVDATDEALGEALGKLYVHQHFPPAAKQKMDQLVANLIKAYAQDIQNLDWMQPETKKAALAKLEKFQPKIGYPDKWKDYSTLLIRADDLVGNVQSAKRWANQDMASRLGKPIDHSLWFMTPQTVNAYYNPVMNEIVFPAGILQPPFFDMNADDAVNYGSIGAVIGHEISHGFDDQGAKYDGDGNLNNWWTDKDLAEFSARGKRLVAQYDQYAPFPDAHVSGEMTLGENIADFGGVAISYQAYLLSLDGKPAPILEGSTGHQRFFYGWAQSWRRKYRDDELRQRLITDFHAPSKYRANGVLSNMLEFYQTFAVQAGDGLYRAEAERIKIW